VVIETNCWGKDGVRPVKFPVVSEFYSSFQNMSYSVSDVSALGPHVCGCCFPWSPVRLLIASQTMPFAANWAERCKPLRSSQTSSIDLERESTRIGKGIGVLEFGSKHILEV